MEGNKKKGGLNKIWLVVAIAVVAVLAVVLFLVLGKPQGNKIDAEQLIPSVKDVEFENMYVAAKARNPVTFLLVDGEDNDMNDRLEGKTVKRIGVPVMKLDDYKKDSQIDVHVVTKTLPATVIRSYPLVIPANTYSDNKVNDWYYFDVDIEIAKGEMLAFGTSAGADGFTFAFVKKSDDIPAVNKTLEETKGFNGSINTGSPVTYADGPTQYGLLFDIYYTETEVDNSNPLKGKYISFMGDSISTFGGFTDNSLYQTGIRNNVIFYPSDLKVNVTDTWWMKTISALDMKLCVNNAWSGSHVSTFKDEKEKAACMDRATLLHNDNLNINPDIIVFAIGANDALGSYEIGSYNGLSDVYDGQNYIGDTKLFAQAYAMMLHKTKTQYPDADIYLFSMLNWPLKKEGGTPIVNYTNVVKQIADEFGVTYVDLFNETDISPETAEKYFYDKVHPTPAGFTQMSDCLIKVLKESYK